MHRLFCVSFYVPKSLTSLPFNIAEAWKRSPFCVGLLLIGHSREYLFGLRFLLLALSHNFVKGFERAYTRPHTRVGFIKVVWKKQKVKKLPLSGRASPYEPLREYPLPRGASEEKSQVTTSHGEVSVLWRQELHDVRCFSDQENFP